jgi:putative Mn2+ efflux pump MntP
MNILMIFLIGLSLSMDTFSLSLSLGTLNISKRRIVIYSLLVGVFHFFLPLLGYCLSNTLKNIITISGNRLLMIVFVFLAVSMLINLFSKEEKEYHFNLIDMFIMALSVSIDSFTIGIGLFFTIKTVLLCCLIFFVLSFAFTILGFALGIICKYRFGKVANLIGLILIIFVMIFS